MKSQKTFIVQPETTEQQNALKAFLKALQIKFEVSKEKPYDPEFVAKIQTSRQDFLDGKGKTMTRAELEKFWK